MSAQKRGQAASSSRQSFWSFWRTLPGIVTVATGLIGAIAGLITAFYTAGIIGGLPDPEAKAEESVILAYKKGEQQSRVGPKCYAFTTHSFEYIPYSLYLTLKDSTKAKNFMYWFHITGENKCPYQLEIIVTFKSLRKKPLVESEYLYEYANKYTIAQGKTFNRKLHPGFKFLEDNVDTTLEVLWEILELPNKNTLEGGKVKIEVLSKNKFAWNLPTPTAGKVSEDFLLGSLAAWTLTHNSAPVKQLAEELRQGLSLGAQPLSFARQFLARCYDGLFRGEFPKVTVNPSLSPFPPQGGIAATREILAPAQILTEHRADPLEAALLVSALSQEYLVKNRGVNLVLFAVSDTEALPHIFLAWHVGLRNWHALDMSSISEMDFDANFSSATEEVKKLLTKRPDISKDLEHDGVFFRRDQSVVALDLGRAASEFGIKSLP